MMKLIYIHKIKLTTGHKMLRFTYIQKKYFNCSAILLVKKKPDLRIETNPSSGSEGLDKEKQWRDKFTSCEHKSLSIYLADENDNNNPMLCDYSNDNKDVQGQSSKDQIYKPNKHPAVSGEFDQAYICDDCLAVICTNCHVEYPSEENTPTNDTKYQGETLQQDTKYEENTFPQDTKYNNSQDAYREGRSNESYSDNTPKETEKKTSSSLLDDYADTSCEPMDYIGGDD